jgi:hypothetical protein
MRIWGIIVRESLKFGLMPVDKGKHGLPAHMKQFHGQVNMYMRQTWTNRKKYLEFRYIW